MRFRTVLGAREDRIASRALHTAPFLLVSSHFVLQYMYTRAQYLYIVYIHICIYFIYVFRYLFVFCRRAVPSPPCHFFLSCTLCRFSELFHRQPRAIIPSYPLLNLPSFHSRETERRSISALLIFCSLLYSFISFYPFAETRKKYSHDKHGENMFIFVNRWSAQLRGEFNFGEKS